MKKIVSNSLISIFAVFAIFGCSSKKVSKVNSLPVIETLINASESWEGETFVYPEGEAAMTLLRITAPAGFRTPVHTHPQPGVAYIVKGQLECVITANKTKIFRSGESFATTFGSSPHYCENIADEDLLVYVAYAGLKGQPVTVNLE